ncbi:DUF4426 domain-containing protein [Halomonas sp. CH40]
MLETTFKQALSRVQLLKQAVLGSLVVSGLSLGATAACAQQYTQVGDYQIHYSAISTDFLSPEVAQTYGIQRSVGLGLVNVSVLQEQEDGSMAPVSASIEGSVGELSGSSSEESLRFKTMRENDTINQISTFTLRHDEPMRFVLDVRYDRNAEPETVSFVERFYIER